MAGKEGVLTFIIKSKEEVREFIALREELGFKTNEETANFALNLLRWVVKNVREGKEIVAYDERNDTIKNVESSALETLRRINANIVQFPYIDSTDE